MASFDNSFYDILNRYKTIKEKYTITDEAGNVISTLDQLPPGIVPAPAAPAVAQSSGTPQQPDQPVPPGEITQQQKDLFKKLHGTSYNPNSSMDKAKMGQLQSAGAEVGYEDINKLTNTAYAKQYGDTAKGRAYAKQAGITQPAQSAPAQSAPAQSAPAQSAPAQSAPAQSPFKNQSAANPMNPTSAPSINTTPSWNAYSKQTEPRPNFTGSNTPPGAPVASPLQNQSSANPLNTGKPGLPTGKPSWNSYSKQKEPRPNFTQKTS